MLLVRVDTDGAIMKSSVEVLQRAKSEQCPSPHTKRDLAISLWIFLSRIEIRISYYCEATFTITKKGKPCKC